MAEKELDPRLLEIMKETGTKLSGDDLSALKTVSVKELIKLWEALAVDQQEPTAAKGGIKSAPKRSKKEIFEEWTKGVVEQYKKEAEKRLASSSQGSHVPKPKVMSDHEYNKSIKEVRSNLKKRIALYEQMVSAKEANDEHAIRELSSLHRTGMKNDLKLRNTSYYETILKKTSNQALKLVRPLVAPQLVTVNEAKNQPLVLASKQLAANGDVLLFLEIASDDTIRDLVVEAVPNQNELSCSVLSAPQIDKIGPEDLEAAVLKVDSKDVITVGGGCQMKLQVHYTDEETGQRKTQILSPIQLGIVDIIEQETKDTTEFENLWFKTGQKNETKETVVFDSPLQEAIDSFVEGSGMIPISEAQQEISTTAVKHTMQFFAKKDEKPILTKVIFTTKSNGTEAVVQTRTELENVRTEAVKNLKSFWENMKQNKEEIVRGVARKIKFEKEEKVKEEHLKAQERLRKEKEEEEAKRKQEEEEMERMLKEQEEEERLAKEEEEKRRFEEQERIRLEEERIRHEEMLRIMEAERIKKEQEELEKLRREEEEKVRLEQKKREEEERRRKEEEEKRRIEEEEKRRREEEEMERMLKEQEEEERRAEEEKRRFEEEQRLKREEEERIRKEQARLELERKEAEERRKREQEEKERQELLKQQVENHRKARIQSLQANMQNFWNKFGQPLKTKEFSGAGSFVVKLHTLPSHQVIEVQISPPQEPNTCYKNVKLEIDPIIIGLVKEPYQVMIDELFPYNSASSVALALKRNEDFPVGQLGELKIMFDSATFEPSNDEIVGELQPYEVSMDNIEFKIGDLNLTQTEPSFEDFKTLWDSGIFSEYGMDTIVSGEHENPVDLVKAFCVSHDLAPVVHVKEGVDEGTCFFGSSYEFPSGDAALVLGKSNKFDNGIVKLKVQVKSSEKKITEKFLKSFCSVYKEHIKPVQMFENKTGHEAAQEKLGVPTAIQKRVLISKPSNPLIKVDVSKRVYSDKKVMLEYHIANNAYSPIENVDILMSGIGYESGGGEGDSIEPSEEAIVCKFVSTDVGEGCITPCLSYSVSGHPEKHELFNVMFGLKDELIPVYPTSDFFEVEWQQSPTFDVLDVAELMSTEISQVSECVNDAFGASKALNQHEVEESSSDTLNYMFTLPSGEDLFVQVVLDPSPKSIKYSLKYKGDCPNLKAYVQSLAAFLRYEVQKRNVILEGEQLPQIPEEDNDQPPIEDSELPELPAEEDKPPELPVEEEDHTKEPLIDEEPEIPDVEEPPIDEEPELPADETPPEILDEEEPPEIPSEYEDTTHEEPPELPTEEEPELPPEDEELQEPELPQEENVQEDTEPPFVDDEEPPVQEEDVPELPPTEETEKVVHIEQQQQTPIEQTKQPEQQPSVGDEAPPKKPEVSEEETFAEEEKVLKQNQVDVSKLANTTWLKPRFVVHQNGSPNDKKIWEIDFFASTFKLFEKKGGKLKSTYQAKDLYSLERHFTDSRRSVLRFFGDKSHHDLVFESNYHRERFFECASCMRKNLFVWCPFVCAPGQVKVISDLKGSFSCVENGQIKKYHGECKVNAYAKAFEPIQVFCMTWNMGGKKAPKDPQELQDILVPGKYDLYAIATQESGFPKDVNKFKAYVENCLGDKYIVLTCITMWEIQLVVLTKKSHFLKISNIQGVQKATGFVKVAGNKGGVGISLCFNDTPMLFISSHLAANHGEGTDDKEYLNLRNQNAQEIIDAMCIGNPTMDISGQFDYIFVMGDTNYRVEMPFDEGVALARNKKYDQLVAKDQLKAQQKLGKVFYGFKENPITFPPSYKYKPGTLEFDNKKKRTPSYTDRILYKTFPACKILSEKYTVKFPECKHPSDHLPVQCVFTVPTHRPFVSVFTSETQYSCQIIFEEIVCKLAVREEIVNPTVTFYASWLDSNEKGEYPMTSKIANTKTPLWAKEQIPILVPATSNVEYLRLKHLTLTIRTGKPEISRGIENLIGTVILPLQNAVAKSPEKNPFKAPIHAQGGLAAGIMEGCYRIVYKKEDVGKKLMNVDTE